MSGAKQKHHWAGFLAAGLSVVSFGAAGCGSGGGNKMATPNAAAAAVSLVDARAINADLAKIRAVYPAVVNVHARPRFEPRRLAILVKPTTPASKLSRVLIGSL